MKELQNTYGGSRRIMDAVRTELGSMKVPSKDEQFVTFVEKVKKIKRDLEAVNLLKQFKNEDNLHKLEKLLTEKINDKWMDFMALNKMAGDNIDVEDKLSLIHI